MSIYIGVTEDQDFLWVRKEIQMQKEISKTLIVLNLHQTKLLNL